MSIWGIFYGKDLGPYSPEPANDNRPSSELPLDAALWDLADQLAFVKRDERSLKETPFGDILLSQQRKFVIWSSPRAHMESRSYLALALSIDLSGEYIIETHVAKLGSGPEDWRKVIYSGKNPPAALESGETMAKEWGSWRYFSLDKERLSSAVDNLRNIAS